MTREVTATGAGSVARPQQEVAAPWRRIRGRIVEGGMLEANDAPGVGALPGARVREEATRRRAQRVRATLAGFFAIGDLSPSPLGEWPPFDNEQRATMRIDLEPTVQLDRDGDRLDFWSRHLGSFAESLLAEASPAR